MQRCPTASWYLLVLVLFCYLAQPSTAQNASLPSPYNRYPTAIRSFDTIGDDLQEGTVTSPFSICYTDTINGRSCPLYLDLSQESSKWFYIKKVTWGVGGPRQVAIFRNGIELRSFTRDGITHSAPNREDDSASSFLLFSDHSSESFSVSIELERKTRTDGEGIGYVALMAIFTSLFVLLILVLFLRPKVKQFLERRQAASEPIELEAPSQENGNSTYNDDTPMVMRHNSTSDSDRNNNAIINNLLLAQQANRNAQERVPTPPPLYDSGSTSATTGAPPPL